MATVKQLLEIWSYRLDRSRREIIKLTPSLIDEIEGFVEKLKNLSPDEQVRIDADINRSRVARFIRVATGEMLGEISQLSEAED